MSKIKPNLKNGGLCSDENYQSVNLLRILVFQSVRIQSLKYLILLAMTCRRQQIRQKTHSVLIFSGRECGQNHHLFGQSGRQF